MRLQDDTKFRYILQATKDIDFPRLKKVIKCGDKFIVDLNISEIEKINKAEQWDIIERYIQLPFVDTDRKPLFIGDKLEFIKDREPDSDIGDKYTIIHSSDNTTCGAIVKMEYSDDENKVEYVRLDRLTSFNLNIYKLGNFRAVGSTLGKDFIKDFL